MAKYAELPNGTLLEFPDDTQDSVIDSVVKKHLGVPETGGIIESAVGSAKRGYEASKTAALAPFIGVEEAAQRGIAAQEGIQERPGFNWQAIKNKYEQEGLLPAAGEAASQIPGTVAEQAPTLGTIFAGGRLGAIGGGKLGGMIGGVPGAAIGATIGGIGGAALYPFLSQSGENIQRQYQEQVDKGETPNVSLGKAYGAGLGQTALEMVLGPEARLLRGAGKEVTEESLKALAKQGTVEGLLRGTGRTLAEEIPTEIAQQSLERLQAGLPISPTDQQALDEYLASGVGAALAGPVGGPMRLMDRGAARDTLAEQERVRKKKEDARFQNIAQNIYSYQGVTLQDIINQNIGIQDALSEKDKKQQDAQYIKDISKWFDEDSGERSTLPDGTEKLLSNYEAYLKQYPVDAELSKKELAEKVVDANKQIESIQEQGQQQIPGLEQGPSTSLFKPSEVSKEDPIANAADYLRSLPKTFTNPSQVKEALESEGSAFKGLNLSPKKVLDLYKTAPVQQQLFDEEGALSPDVIKGYENQQKINQAMADKLKAAKPNETLDIFGRASVAPHPKEEVAPEVPSQGGSANLLIQQAMKEAEQQTAIDQANRARQTLYGLPETSPMGYASAEQRAQSIQESAPYQQRALDIQQRLQEEELKAQQKKASEAMAKKLEQAKPGETLDIFGNARVAPQVQEEITSEAPSQGGSANLQIQQAIREAELNNDVEKANRLRQQLYATPEGELLSSTQQQQRVEAEPFKLLNEKKTADLKAAREEGRLPTDAVTPETLTTLSPDLGKTAIAKRIASSPANYSMNNAEGLNDVVKSLQAISTKKPELAPSVNPFLANLKKHVETLSSKKPDIKKSETVAPVENPHTAESLQEALTKLYGNNAPKITIGSLADVNNDTSVQGYYHPDTGVTLIPENIDQSKDLHGLIRHEVAVHAQRLGKTDQEFQAILTQLQALRDKGAKAVQEAYARVPKDTDPDLVHEEALGYLAEHAKQLPIVQRFMSWLRRTAYKLTGSAKWLKEHDFAKMADEVLKKQPKETQQRTVEKPLYSKAQQRTQFDVPVKEDKGSLSDRLQANVNKAKAATKNSVIEGVKNQLNNIRTATTHQAAIIASKDYQKLAGKLADEQGEAIASVLIDQAYDGDKIAAAAAHTGKPVITKKGISVVKDSNNVEQIFTLVHDFADKLGDKVEGKNIVNRYLLARRYNNIINSGKGYVSPEQQRLTKQFIGLNKQYPALTKIVDMVDATQYDLLDFMVAAGLLPKEKADLYKSEKGYVPLYRIMDDIESTNPGMKQYFGGLTDIGTEKAFKGSDKESLDVLDNIMTRYMWAVQAGSRNFAMQKIAKDYGVMGENGETKYYSSEPKANKEYFAPVMMNGKRRWVEYADPKIPGAVKPVASLGPLLSFFSGASRILRTGVTALPTFGAAQVVMDAQRAALYSGVNRPFELMGRVLKSYYDILKNPNNETIERLHAHGISGGYGHTTQEITNRMRRKVGLDATTSINRIWDKIDDFSAASDMAQRKAIYEQTMKETNDELLALHRARNIINWRHRGDNTAVHMITQIVPFANAYAQSMDVQLSAMMGAGIMGKNKQAAFFQFLRNAAIFMGISAVYSMVMAGDDEYEKMSEREKLNSFLIPGTGGVTIPVPSDVGLLYKALPEFAWRYITKDFVENPRDATKLRKAFREAFLDSVSGPNLMPQLVKGIVEIETNHNFMTGNPIVGHGLENLEPFKQYGESTSEIAKTIGEKMNWSPVKVDHLIKAYAGTLGSLTLLTTDQLINAMSDVKKPESHWYKNPMVSRFMADPRYKSQIDDYYDLLERSNVVTNTIANYRKHGDIEGAKAYREEHKEMTHVRQQVLNLQGQMAKIREQRNRIIDAKNISAEEKSQKIEVLDERTGRMLKNIGKIRLKAGL